MLVTRPDVGPTTVGALYVTPPAANSHEKAKATVLSAVVTGDSVAVPVILLLTLSVNDWNVADANSAQPVICKLREPSANGVKTVVPPGATIETIVRGNPAEPELKKPRLVHPAVIGREDDEPDHTPMQYTEWPADTAAPNVTALHALHATFAWAGVGPV